LEGITMTNDAGHLTAPDGNLEPTWAFLTFHDALRRDASRFTAASPRLDADAAADGLARHWRHYRALLEFHHTTEDTALFSTVRQAAPELRAVLDDLEADHLALDTHLHRLDRLVSTCGSADHDPDVLTAAFADLEGQLGPHLATEEHDLVPVIRRIIDEAAAADPAAGAPPPPAAGPVPADFAHPWNLEHLDGATLQLAMGTLGPADAASYAQRLSEYRADLSRWSA
jgi:hypothetical protein